MGYNFNTNIVFLSLRRNTTYLDEMAHSVELIVPTQPIVTSLLNIGQPS